MGVGDWLFDLFANLGDQGILIAIFLLFLLDAILVPTLPELFFILGVGANPSWGFGFSLLIAGFLGELVGTFSIYFFVSRIRVPARIDNALKKYVDFLVVSDEKVVLINRVAPMVPFVGAFMAVMRKRWDVKKCVFWLMIGYFMKYGIVMAMGESLIEFFDGGTARTVMLIAIIVFMAISAGVAYYKKTKLNKGRPEGARDEDSDSD